MTAVDADSGSWARQQTANARLHGWWLKTAWVIWLAVATLSVACLVVAIPKLWAQVVSPSGAARADLARLGLPLTVYAACLTAIQVAVILSFFGIATLLFQRRSGEAIAVMTSMMFFGIGVSFLTPVFSLLSPSWLAVTNVLSQIGWDAIFIFCYLFPDGHFRPRWTRWVLIPLLVPQLVSIFFPNLPANPNSGPVLINVLFTLILYGSCLYAQFYRYRRVSTPAQRQQTKWVVYGLVSMLVLLLPYQLLPFIAPSSTQSGSLLASLRGVLVMLPYPLIPLTFGFAILRYRLWDIDVLINRTLVYGGLTVMVVAGYVLVVGALGRVVALRGNLTVSLVATGLIAALFQPARQQLQRGVNRLMFGERDDPYAVLSRLGQRLGATLAVDAVLPTIVQTITEALKLPYAAISVERGGASAVVATSGIPAESLLRLPLMYQHDTVGTLLLAPRAAGEAFSPADRRLLDDLARQIGVAAHAVRLTDDLQRSRERLVTTREEERRRLRRDLHDGLGPALASLTMQAEAARDLMTADRATAEAMLTDLIGQLQEATADVRRLVYALRPPALDDLGLVAALRAHAAGYDHTGLEVTIDSPSELPPLPAAVEVAAYRITQEALTNVARHAEAERCAIKVVYEPSEPTLLLAINDDGRGLPEDARAGVGLRSMRERAEELGGSWAVESEPGGGTRVRARLPLTPTPLHTGPGGGAEATESTRREEEAR